MDSNIRKLFVFLTFRKLINKISLIKMIEKNIGKDASYINRLNKIEVLKIIRECKQISRADIVKRINLSAPTVTRIVEGLINDKLVVMVGEGTSTGGRPPKLLKFDGSHDYVIGVDLGSTSIRGVISDLDGKFITEIEMPTDLKGGFEKICLQVVNLIEKLIFRSKLDKENVLGLGLAIAGYINGESGMVEYSPVFNWQKVNVKTELVKHIKLPIYCDNVSRVTAMGELVYGVGKKYSNFISVNAGYGIGAGIVINGNPFFGSRGFAGELGHLVVDSKSEYSGKGSIQGSFESLASGYGIAEAAKRKLQNQSQHSKIMESVNGNLELITAKIVIDSAKKGDALALKIFNEAMTYWGIGLDVLIKLFDPEVIVIAGGLIRSGDIFFESLKRSLEKNRLTDVNTLPLILPSSFGREATLFGCLSLVISKVLRFEEQF
jgi:predicted NBD/HSP70 family sugar kinase